MSSDMPGATEVALRELSERLQTIPKEDRDPALGRLLATCTAEKAHEIDTNLMRTVAFVAVNHEGKYGKNVAVATWKQLHDRLKGVNPTLAKEIATEALAIPELELVAKAALDPARKDVVQPRP